MWALGIILCELINKKHPVTKESDITDSNSIEIPSTVPTQFRSLIALLLSKNPATRPSSVELLNIPEVKEAVNNLLNKIGAIDPDMAKKISENLNQS
jgi:serine/threonine protein kinase